MEISLMMMLSVITFILTFSSLLETTQSRMFRQPRTNVLLSDREHEAVNRPSLSPPPPPRSAPPSRPASHSSSLSASYYINKLESFIFPPTRIGSNNWYGHDSPNSPPSPTANTPGRQIDGDQYVAATGGYRRSASHSLFWPFPLSASYYVNKLESFIFPPAIIGSNNWYGRDSPKSPPSPTANTPGRQIDGDQYVAVSGGYRRPAMVEPPPPYPPAVVGLPFSRTSLQEPQLDESS